MKAKSSGISLTEGDAAIIKGMLARGDRQHDIAAWFGVNGGRIAEIANGKTFSHVPMQKDNLPPAGPYISGRTSSETRVALQSMKVRLEEILKEIEHLLKQT